MMEISSLGSALLGALIGGLSSGLCAIYATKIGIREEAAKERRREEREVEHLLDALTVELKTLWEFHMKRIGLLVENLQPGQALEFYYPLTQDYFTIYDSNAALIGRIPDSELGQAIVVCYTKAKKVVDGLKYNNELYNEYMNALNKNLEPALSTCRKKCQDYAAIVKEDHFEMKGYVENLAKLLKKNQDNVQKQQKAA